MKIKKYLKPPPRKIPGRLNMVTSDCILKSTIHFMVESLDLQGVSRSVPSDDLDFFPRKLQHTPRAHPRQSPLANYERNPFIVCW